MSNIEAYAKGINTINLRAKRAMQSFKNLIEYFDQDPQAAVAMLESHIHTPVEFAYEHDAAAYFMFGYIQAAYTFKRFDHIKFLLSKNIDFDSAGYKPSDYLGINRKYGKLK